MGGGTLVLYYVLIGTNISLGNAKPPKIRVLVCIGTYGWSEAIIIYKHRAIRP